MTGPMYFAKFNETAGDAVRGKEIAVLMPAFGNYARANPYSRSIDNVKIPGAWIILSGKLMWVEASKLDFVCWAQDATPERMSLFREVFGR